MLLTIISFIFVLSVLVFVHELGHFLVAKWAGIGVERFSIGFPPKIFSRRIGETEYCISAIPFGGYVKLSGETVISENDEEPSPNYFIAKPIPVRIAVLSAGPLMNAVFALVVMYGIIVIQGLPKPDNRIGFVEENTAAARAGFKALDRIIKVDGKEIKSLNEFVEHAILNKENTVIVERGGTEHEILFTFPLDNDQNPGFVPFYEARVGSLDPDGPAAKSGMIEDDLIKFINGEPVSDWFDMSLRIRSMPDKEVKLDIERDGVSLDIILYVGKHRVMNENGEEIIQGRIGIGSKVEMIPVGMIQAIPRAVKEVWGYTRLTVNVFYKLVTGRISTKMLGGPVMIAKLAGQSAQSGFFNLLGFMVFLSIHFAILNLLPIPVIDGGQIIVLIIEGIFRRSVSLKVRVALQYIGAFFLLSLMLYVTMNDVMRISIIKNLFNSFKSLF